MTFPYESREFPEPVASGVEACILSGEDMKAGVAKLREQFAPGVLSIDKIANGHVYWFERSEEWLNRVSAFVCFESQCCPHLDLGIGLQAGGRLISLRVSSASGSVWTSGLERIVSQRKGGAVEPERCC